MQVEISVQLTREQYSHVCVTLQESEFGSRVLVRYQRHRISERNLVEVWEVEMERAQYMRELDFGVAMSRPYAAEVVIPHADSWGVVRKADKALKLLAKAESLSLPDLVATLKRAKVPTQWVYHDRGRDVEVAEMPATEVGNAHRFLHGLHCTQILADDMLARARQVA